MPNLRNRSRRLKRYWLVTAGLLRGDIEPKAPCAASKLRRDFIQARKNGYLERQIEELKRYEFRTFEENERTQERHENLKKRGYTGWAYDPQAVQDYQERERAHKGS